MTEASREYRLNERNKFVKIRPEFVKDTVAKYPEELKSMGIDDEGLAKMKEGRMPVGYTVHCVLPIHDGGPAKPFNLVIMPIAEHDTVHHDGVQTASADQRRDLRDRFQKETRAAFLKDLAEKDPDGLKAMGIDSEGIAAMKEGHAPKGFTVHHKVPLHDGGTNSFLNIALLSIKDHDALHFAMAHQNDAEKVAYPTLDGDRKEQTSMKKMFNDIAKTEGGKELIDLAAKEGYTFFCEVASPDLPGYLDFDAKICGLNPAHPESTERLTSYLKAIRNLKAVESAPDKMIATLRMMENADEKMLKQALDDGYKFSIGQTPSPARAYTDKQNKKICISDRISDAEKAEMLAKQLGHATEEPASKYIQVTRNRQGR